MSFTSREFRDALGRFATGVCVITANPPGFRPFGMTVNSFASVSLDPALVLWSLQKNSECAGAFEAARQFTVNVLGLHQKDVSNRYARKGDHDLQEGEYRLGRSGCVVLKDALTSFECNLHSRIDGGDHIILLGHVVEMANRPSGKPLVFYSGQYRELK
jgi:flavin reductase (DIM6/NTAB) family NADH-FMN oxidoreductase RutF